MRIYAKELGIKPIAKLIEFQVAGCDATRMGMGPVYAIPKVSGCTLASSLLRDMDVIELNEAFASQALACVKNVVNNPMLDGFQEMWDEAKVNPYGGAMALGHPHGRYRRFPDLQGSRLPPGSRYCRQVWYGYHVHRRRYGMRYHR